MDISKIPLATNPSGAPPNFIDTPSLKTTMLSVGLTLITLSITFIILRLVTNVKHTRKLAIDDGKTLLSCMLLIASADIRSTLRFG